MAKGELPEGSTWADLALFPKTDAEALQPSETRPLSLAKCDAKLLASALRARLDPLVDAVLLPTSLAFAARRPRSTR